VDDDLAFLRSWGFGVRDISVPVLIAYGETDVLVPAAHGAWLAANVPDCVVKIDDEAGHMGSDPEREIAENPRWLRDGVPPAKSLGGAEPAACMHQFSGFEASLCACASSARAM
jgi:hypothetical protein